MCHFGEFRVDVFRHPFAHVPFAGIADDASDGGMVADDLTLGDVELRFLSQGQGAVIGGGTAFAVGPFTAALRRALLRVVTAPFRLAAALVLRPVAQSILRRHKASVKKRKEKKKSAKHPLQEGGKVLYNSN